MFVKENQDRKESYKCCCENVKLTHSPWGSRQVLLQIEHSTFTAANSVEYVGNFKRAGLFVFFFTVDKTFTELSVSVHIML